MLIYEVLPKVEIPGVGGVMAYIDSPLEYSAESQEFTKLTRSYEAPLSDKQFVALCNAAPPGWRQAFTLLRDSLIR